MEQLICVNEVKRAHAWSEQAVRCIDSGRGKEDTGHVIDLPST